MGSVQGGDAGCGELDAMPHLHVSDGAVKVAIVGPSGSAEPVLSASHDIGLVPVSLGAIEDAILVNLHGGALHGDHNVCPGRGVKIARSDVPQRRTLKNIPRDLG